jgi:hypothetical protein
MNSFLRLAAFNLPQILHSSVWFPLNKHSFSETDSASIISMKLTLLGLGDNLYLQTTTIVLIRVGDLPC